MLEPRVSRRERKLQLSYELPSRIHCSAIYPLLAPNGSEIVVYGHDAGIRVLWRGGKRRKEPKGQPSKADTNDPDVIVISDDDEEPEAQAQGELDDYEDDEDDDDPDLSYPAIVQEVDFEQECGVLQIAVPSTSPAALAQLPDFAKSHMMIAQAREDGRIALITLPLKPPTSAEKEEGNLGARIVEQDGDGSIVRSLGMKLVQAQDDDDTESSSGWKVSVAVAGRALTLWSLAILADEVAAVHAAPLPTPSPISSVAFPYARTQTQLLLSDRSGVVRLFDASLSGQETNKPSSRGFGDSSGPWIMSYYAPFHTIKHTLALSRRKYILDVDWVLGGRAILVLLEDGQWGLWDLQGSGKAGKSIQDFALHGYLGSTAASPGTTDNNLQRKPTAKLAPMTPNTRRSSDKLFSGPEKVAGVAASGCISVATISSRSGMADESVVICYQNEIYSIPSMQAFWQRSTTSTGGSFGSLYTPGLTHVTDINLMNENITSISQFASHSPSNSLGRVNLQRDLLVSTEHRLITLHHPKSAAKAGLFAHATTEAPAQDQRMLDVGELDLGGLDRMLDGMSGNQRPRRVGFASS